MKFKRNQKIWVKARFIRYCDDWAKDEDCPAGDVTIQLDGIKVYEHIDGKNIKARGK